MGGRMYSAEDPRSWGGALSPVQAAILAADGKEDLGELTDDGKKLLALAGRPDASLTDKERAQLAGVVSPKKSDKK